MQLRLSSTNRTFIQRGVATQNDTCPSRQTDCLRQKTGHLHGSANCPGPSLARQNRAAVAQLVEHVIRNDGVGGSSPFSGTTSQVLFENYPRGILQRPRFLGAVSPASATVTSSAICPDTQIILPPLYASKVTFPPQMVNAALASDISSKGVTNRSRSITAISAR